jgi:hypothetical protein
MSRLLTKRALALMLLLFSALVLAGWTQQWLWCDLNSSEIRQSELSLTGQESTILPAGLALVGFALALLLLMAARVLGVLIGALGLLVAISGVTLTATFIRDPIAFALSALSKLSGIADDDVLRSFVTSFSVSWGVWLTAMSFLAMGLLSLAVIVRAPRWKPNRSRYETSARPRRTETPKVSGQNTIDAWDEITRGDDPTA